MRLLVYEHDDSSVTPRPPNSCGPQQPWAGRMLIIPVEMETVALQEASCASYFKISLTK